jgi:hypothetical protein
MGVLEQSDSIRFVYELLGPWAAHVFRKSVCLSEEVTRLAGCLTWFKLGIMYVCFAI